MSRYQAASHQDVLIIGGGPAGLAAAIALRLRGFRVTVADPHIVDENQPAIDKACGEGLMPGALVALAKLGVRLPSGVPFPGIRFLDENISVESRFPEGCGLGVRRAELHRALQDRALETGVELRWGAAVRSLNGISKKWVVGADGEHSQVRSWAGLDSAWMESRRFGYRRHYRLGDDALPPGCFVEVYWGPGCQLYVTQVGQGEICVSGMSRNPRLRLEDIIRRIPRFARKLQGALPISTERGAVSASRFLRRVQRGNVALIGDASGSVDAITGEGLRLSFEQSLGLAGALEQGDPRVYEKEHRRYAGRPLFMAKLLLAMDRSIFLRRRTLSAFAREPQVFTAMLAAHVGQLPMPEFVREGMLPLARQILTQPLA